MQVSVILTQMGVILIFLAVGFLAKRQNWIDNHGTKSLSWLIVYVCGPSLVLSSVLNSEAAIPKLTAIEIIGLIFVLYIILIIIGTFIGRLCGAPKSDWRFFGSMNVFGNVGFLGIPMCAAIFGSDAAIYMSMFTLAYNGLFYTYGYSVLRPDDGPKDKFSFKRFLNPGAISAVLAMVFLFSGIKMPGFVSESVRYCGNAVTFLSVFVIGANLSDIKLGGIIRKKQNLMFILIRQLIIPIIFVLILKLFITDVKLLGALALGIAVPVGNTNSMVAELNGCDLTALTEVTVLSTFLCVITMTVVLLFVV